jgi:indolepyruvate ferredoxin oxidoreductase
MVERLRAPAASRPRPTCPRGRPGPGSTGANPVAGRPGSAVARFQMHTRSSWQKFAMTAPFRPPLADYDMSDRYTRTEGRVFLTGTQALVRILLDQARRDRAAGLKTAASCRAIAARRWAARSGDCGARATGCSRRPDRVPAGGERGSGATACWARSRSRRTRCAGRRASFRHVVRQGAGRGPVGRCAQAWQCLWLQPAWRRAGGGGRRPWLRLVLDAAPVGRGLHGLVHADAEPGERGRVPALRRMGLRAVALLGLWVGFKAVSDVVEAGMSVDLLPDRVFEAPDFTPPPGGLHYRWPDLPGPRSRSGWRQEARGAGLRRGQPDRPRIYGIPRARFGFVTTGKGHLDLMEALRLLGSTSDACRGSASTSTRSAWSGRWRAARRAGFRARQGARCWWSRKSAASSRASSRNISTTGPATSRADGRQARREGRPADPLDGRASPRQLLPIVAPGGWTGSSREGFPKERAARITGRAEPQVLNRSRAPRARPISARAARTTPRPACPRAARRWPASAATSWRPGWTANTSLIQMGGEGVNWALLALHRQRTTCSRTWARAPGIIPARWRSGRRSRRGQHHLQDPLQRRRRHDRRPAGGRPGQRAGHRADLPRRRGGADRAGLRRHRQVRRADFPPAPPSTTGASWTRCSASCARSRASAS